MEFHPMSPEEMQRTMQFLLAQQASFAADFERLTAKTDRMADAIIGLTGIVGRIADQQERLGDQLQRLTDQQEKHAKDTKARMDDLGEYIKTVESHLNVVIEMFERHLREDHGQRPS